MAVYRPIYKERRSSKAGTTETTYTKRRTTYGYIDSSTGPNQAHCLQSALRRIQGRSTRTREEKTGYKRYQ
jgi:hypothetical protein